MKNILPLILVILDGWGIAKPNKGNAITSARTPTMNGLLRKYPNTELSASGKSVGLPPSQSGNSEAGHMNLGAGRIVEQDAVKIGRSINDGTFFKNQAFIEAIRQVKRNKSNLHLMGMISNGMSAHSDPDHLLALLAMARKNNLKKIYLHLFTDGRDSPQYSSLKLIEDLQKILKNSEAIATIMGRFYAMDRKKTWARTEKAYGALVLGQGRQAASAGEAITESYNRGESDEFIEPYIITKKGKSLPRISNSDSLIFFNLRSDRARQLAKMFAQRVTHEQASQSFKRIKFLKDLKFVVMTDFGPDLDNIITAFPSADLKQSLPMALKNLSQLYIAESEKYAHVTYFFNGLNEAAHKDEAHALVPSKSDTTYEESPEMSAREIGQRMVEEIGRGTYRFILANFANADVVAHTGNLGKTIEAVSAIDREIGIISEAVLLKGGMLFITSDHGNAESVVDITTGRLNKSHTGNPVPFLIIGREFEGKTLGFDDAPGGDLSFLKPSGLLSDVAPTILKFCGLKKPVQMIGRSLV